MTDTATTTPSTLRRRSGGLSAGRRRLPPTGNTGGKQGTKSRSKARPEVGIDWFSCVLPDARLGDAVRLIEESFGPTTRGAGLRFMRGGGFRVCGGGVFYDGDKDYVLVDVNGGMCGLLTPADRVRLLSRLLALGGRATRLDIALDYKEGTAGDVISRVIESCAAGELTGARFNKTVASKSGREDAGRTVYLGKRGSAGSGRMVRVYDKGAESNDAPVGEWTRWEAVLSGQIAASTAVVVACAADPDVVMLEIALGCMDFREVKPGETALSRRPRVAWFAEFIRGVTPEKVVARPVSSSVDGYCRWMKRCVVPQLRRYADAVGVSLPDFLERVGGTDVATADILGEEVGLGLLSEFDVDITKRKTNRPGVPIG